MRYPPGSNAMGLLATILVDGGGRLPRQLRFLGQVLRHPITFARSLSVRRWSERSVILLVMQSLDNRIRLTLRNGRLGKRLRSQQDDESPNPSYIPIANEAARVAARAVNGFASSAVNEVLLDVPTTAHIIGGSPMGVTGTTGVIDAYHRIHGHDGLHVVDGAAVPANLGVNPALTITAMAERAMAYWPNRGEADPRPPMGSSYEDIARVFPTQPVVPSGAPGALRTTDL
jgi:cholesterol oxidase